jgi:hypothetical protein
LVELEVDPEAVDLDPESVEGDDVEDESVEDMLLAESEAAGFESVDAAAPSAGLLSDELLAAFGA